MSYEDLVARIDKCGEEAKTHGSTTYLPMVLNSIRAVVELHKPETNYIGRLVCGYCVSLCHSSSGLYCEWEGDALYPCDTIQAIEKELL